MRLTWGVLTCAALVASFLPGTAAADEPVFDYWCSDGALRFQVLCTYWYCDPYENCHSDRCVLWDGNYYECWLDLGLG